MKRLIAAAVLLPLSGSLHAASVQITFDPPTLPGGSRVESTFTQSGMTFTGRFASTDSGVGSFPDNGSGYLQVAVFGSLSFAMSDSSLFNVLSVDLAEYSTVFESPTTISFTGFKPDGSTVTTSFLTDGIIDGSGPLVDFETFAFGSDFRGLTSVQANNVTFSMDNLLVAPIPLPAAFWLFATALVSVGAGRVGTVQRR
ncbi:MAG: hypothetical protein AAGA68_22555 [Pseudomonadota bacterium]